MNCKASSFRRVVFLAFLAAGAAFAQKDLVKWSLTLDPPAAAPGSIVTGRLEARIDPGWHMYSFTPVKGANIPSTLKLGDGTPVERFQTLQPAPKRAVDPNFEKTTETYEGTVLFLVRLQLKKAATAGPAEVTLHPRYQVCDSGHCIPPVTKDVTATLTVDPAATVPAAAIPAGYAEPAAAPVETASGAPAGDLAPFLAVAFGFGLLTIFTPCVFPMIPITMSFFLNRQSGSRRPAIFMNTLNWATHTLRGQVSSPWLDLILVLAAIVCGAIIGAEREQLDKPAGLRTLLLVCLGSALFTMVSFQFTTTTGDSGRVAAQIVTGIGFLGGGAILHSKSSITGMTTAATIWLTAAIGITIGAGLPLPGLVVTLVVRGVLAGVLKWEVRHLGGMKSVAVELVFDPDHGKTRIRLERICQSFRVRWPTSFDEQAGERSVQLRLDVRLPRRHLYEFLDEVVTLPAVHEIRELHSPSGG